ncbi:MAG: hypothetical protein R3257_04565 [bacterium]|nr:hypothetical protein [bacterium]
MKTKLSAFLLATFAILTVSATGHSLEPDEVMPPPPEVTDLGEEHYFRVTVPEDQVDFVEVSYMNGGEEKIFEAPDLLASTLFIGMKELGFPFNSLDVPFSAKVDGDDIVFKLKKPDTNIIYSNKLRAENEGEETSVIVSKQSEIRITVPGGKLHLLEAGNLDELANNEGPQEILSPKHFLQEGEVEIYFFIKPVSEEGSEDGDNEDGQDDGQSLGFPEGNASGGCSLASGGSPATPALAYLLLAISFMGVRRFSRRK